ncbi:hypothetical protein [Nocardia transvalensis]|uniref:hypothetical protein n=1 Tax=Nocardia transvalensis TaxID=37333 RepID=UPI001894734D|nr:hypothetical protein [Nocardia transvalensis]MBF6328126.1 hypothetical protein [Nocardia transvalensis]
MTNLEARAEVIKLARELLVEPGELRFLEDAAPEAIRTFRKDVHRRLDAPHRPMFQRLARVSALVPGPLAVRIAMRFYGPMFVGMVATEVPPERAVGLIGHVPTQFLADATPYVDPDAAGPILHGLPTETMIPTMLELLRRKDYVTLARFVAAASDELIFEVLPHIESGEDLLLIGFNAEVADVAGRFDTILGALPPDRLRSLVQAAVDTDRFVETLTILQFLRAPTLTRIADTTADMGPQVMTALVEAAHRENAWAELIPVAAAMSGDRLEKFAALDVWTEEALTGVVRAAASHDLWAEFVPLAAATPDERLRILAELPVWHEIDSAPLLSAIEAADAQADLAVLVSALPR